MYRKLEIACGAGLWILTFVALYSVYAVFGLWQVVCFMLLGFTLGAGRVVFGYEAMHGDINNLLEKTPFKNIHQGD